MVFQTNQFTFSPKHDILMRCVSTYTVIHKTKNIQVRIVIKPPKYEHKASTVHTFLITEETARVTRLQMTSGQSDDYIEGETAKGNINQGEKDTVTL